MKLSTRSGTNLPTIMFSTCIVEAFKSQTHDGLTQGESQDDTGKLNYENSYTILW